MHCVLTKTGSTLLGEATVGAVEAPHSGQNLEEAGNVPTHNGSEHFFTTNYNQIKTFICICICKYTKINSLT